MTRQSPAGEPGQSSSSVAGNDLPSLARASDQNHDTSQTALFDVPRSRGSYSRDGELRVDPWTSRAAAKSISLDAVSRLQRIVVNVFTLHRGPLTDEQLIEAVHRHFPQVRATDSSIRTRRRELERRGLVEVADFSGRTAAGYTCRRFKATGADA